LHRTLPQRIEVPAADLDGRIDLGIGCTRIRRAPEM